MASTTAIRKSRPCRRCGGTGTLFGGACFNCHGSGIGGTSTPAPRRHNVDMAQRTAMISILRGRAIHHDDGPNGSVEFETTWGLRYLEDNAPQRFEKLAAFIEKAPANMDRIDQAIAALRAYWKEQVATV